MILQHSSLREVMAFGPHSLCLVAVFAAAFSSLAKGPALDFLQSGEADLDFSCHRLLFIKCSLRHRSADWKWFWMKYKTQKGQRTALMRYTEKSDGAGSLANRHYHGPICTNSQLITCQYYCVAQLDKIRLSPKVEISILVECCIHFIKTCCPWSHGLRPKKALS